MSNMRTTLVMEAERNGKMYTLVAPATVNMVELLDVCKELLGQCIEAVGNIEKQTQDTMNSARELQGRGEEAADRLNKIIEAEKEKAK